MKPMTLTIPSGGPTEESMRQLTEQIQHCMINDQPVRIDPRLPEDAKEYLESLIYKAAYEAPDSDYAYFLNELRTDKSVTFVPMRATKVEKWFDDE